jgi:hypothetical protein
VVERNHKTGIEIWARAARTRLYRIEYSRRMEASLEAARDQAKGGLPVVMRRQEPEGKGRATSRASDPGEALYQSNVMLPSEINPKS